MVEHHLIPRQTLAESKASRTPDLQSGPMSLNLIWCSNLPKSRYITHTNCDLVRPGLPVGDYLCSRLSCNARRAKCALVFFLQEHQAELQKLEQKLAAASPKKVNPRTLVALKKINIDINMALGQRSCWHLGDVIIALEMPDDAIIYTTDGHFDLICSALGKQVFLESMRYSF